MSDLIAKTAIDRRLADIIGPVIEGLGFELVRIRLMGGKTRTLQIMVDRPDGGIEVDECATCSTAISAVLDVEDPIEDNYILEVSSPGIDRPLTRPKDFIRFAGHRAKIELVSPDAQGRRRYTVDIESANETSVTLALSKEESLTIPYANIGEAKLVLTDRLIEESQAAHAAMKH